MFLTLCEPCHKTYQHRMNLQVYPNLHSGNRNFWFCQMCKRHFAVRSKNRRYLHTVQGKNLTLFTRSV